eukprot:scaffold1638_cov258-Pinguiococcus_pyrenoidosus.AAC.40
MDEGDKVFYALGVNIASNLGGIGTLLEEAEVDLVTKGIADALKGSADEEVPLPVYGPKVNEMVQSRLAAQMEQTKSEGAAAVESAAKEPNAVQTDSGLVVQTLTEGDGDSPGKAPPPAPLPSPPRLVSVSLSLSFFGLSNREHPLFTQTLMQRGARRAGLLSPHQCDPRLDGGPPAHEGWREGEAYPAARARVRESATRGADPRWLDVGLRGGAAGDRLDVGQAAAGAERDQPNHGSKNRGSLAASELRPVVGRIRDHRIQLASMWRME